MLGVLAEVMEASYRHFGECDPLTAVVGATGSCRAHSSSKQVKQRVTRLSKQ